MHLVLTMNQRDSRRAGDRVPELLHALRPVAAALPFQRSVGDEVQGVALHPQAAVEAVLVAARQRRWNIGVGIGPLATPLPPDMEAARGAGMSYSRQAVERSRKGGERQPVAVTAHDTVSAGQAEAVLCLLARIVAERSAAEWRVLDLLVPGARGQQKYAAQELGISAQAVSRAVIRSQWLPEQAARPAAARLLQLCLPAEVPTGDLAVGAALGPAGS